MRIKTTGSTHSLYRYGGSVDGKGGETKIASVAVGTKPDAIPDDVRDNVTPKEMRELVEFLAGEHITSSRNRVADLARLVDEIAPVLTAEILDADTAAKLTDALARARSAMRRVERQQQPKPAANDSAGTPAAA